jgi:tRNA threonylcarbamoyl adenosine modification protein YeaZ
MDIEKKIYLAMDTAYENGIVALLNKDEILFSVVLKEKMAHSKEICQAIANAITFSLEYRMIISGVFVGLGPGSFVGVRIALATALGFTFMRNLPLMGFCSHLALAYSCSDLEKKDDFTLFMKASGDLGYFTEFSMVNGFLINKAPTKVLSIHDLFAHVKEGSTIFSDQQDKLSLLNNGLSYETILGPDPEGTKNAALYRMHSVGSFIDESNFIKPNYVKPPNASILHKSFSFAHRVD